MTEAIILLSFCLGLFVGYWTGRSAGRLRTVADATEARAQVLRQARVVADTPDGVQRPIVRRVSYRRFKKP